MGDSLVSIQGLMSHVLTLWNTKAAPANTDAQSVTAQIADWKLQSTIIGSVNTEKAHCSELCLLCSDWYLFPINAKENTLSTLDENGWRLCVTHVFFCTCSYFTEVDLFPSVLF